MGHGQKLDDTHPYWTGTNQFLSATVYADVWIPSFVLRWPPCIPYRLYIYRFNYKYINGSYIYIYMYLYINIYIYINSGINYIYIYYTAIWEYIRLSIMVRCSFSHFLFQSSHSSQIHDFAKRNRLDAQAAVKLAEARAALVVHPKIISIVYRQFISQGKTWVYSQSVYL
jgi:hypothetical protein